MKKICCLLLAVAIIFSCCSCRMANIKYEQGSYYVILPISNSEVAVNWEIEKYINYINYELLKEAEAEITNKCFPEFPEFSIKLDNENYLILSSQELIVETKAYDEVFGEYDSHKHVWHTKRISLSPVK